MWSFFRQIFGLTESAELTPIKAKPMTPIYSVTDEMVSATIDACYGSGVRYALLYANMGGYMSEIVASETLVDFIRIINADPDFTEEGIEYAVDRLYSGMDILLATGDTFIYGVRGERNQHLRPTINAVSREASISGFKALCAGIGFDLVDFLINSTIERRSDDLRRVREKLDEKQEYLKPLLRRALQKGKTKYGDLDATEFNKELGEFINHFFPEDEMRFFYHFQPMDAAINHVGPWFTEWLSGGTSVDIPIDGVDFEHWCAEQLTRQGWICTVSKASGDQGIDIEAHYEGRTVAIQCKRYHQPIGNKAVQEVYAGMVHYQAHAACVIGTGGFTKSAVELARNTGVILLEAEHIHEFSNLFRRETIN